MPVDTLSPMDRQHLQLVSTFHYVIACVSAVFACAPVLHLLLGAIMVFGPGMHGRAQERMPVALVGGAFMAFAGVWMLLGWTLAVCEFMVGKNIGQRTRYTFCLVVAGVEAAVCMPMGTILGILTIIVPLRPAVRNVFGES